jgi:hypothetical protein
MKSASTNLELVDQDPGVPLERKSQITSQSSVLESMAFIFWYEPAAIEIRNTAV